jgi:ferric-dicitrate binding protein FerR (iron transport regulator)
MEVMLPDGSSVHLRPNSEVEYNSLFWSFNRTLELRGTAFFDVAEGRKFVVKTDQGSVKVLGTSFTVAVGEDYLDVACKTGKVGVSAKGETCVLQPGMEIEISEEGAVSLNRSPENIGQWITETYTFRNVPLQDVFQAIEEGSGYRIQYQAEAELTYSGEFRNDLPMEEMLQIICLPFDLEYRIDKTTKEIQILKM